MNIILTHHYIVARFCYQISLLSCLIHADFNKTLSKSKLKKSFINKSVTLLHFYLLKQIANHFLLSLFLGNFPANFFLLGHIMKRYKLNIWSHLKFIWQLLFLVLFKPCLSIYSNQDIDRSFNFTEFFFCAFHHGYILLLHYISADLWN